ncbi:MAG: sulfatase-like hydrolase/transferase [Ginsengibacter sp.]
MRLLRSRYSVLTGFLLFFLGASFLLRAGLLILSFSRSGLHLIDIPAIFLTGFCFDLVVACLIVLLYSVYLLLLPQKINKSLFNRILTYAGFVFVSFLVIFSFFAEVTFWLEFKNRFNFIAVDYLVYTYEVIHNIDESYPLPLLIGGMVSACLLLTWILNKTGIFKNSFHSDTRFSARLLYTGIVAFIALGGISFLSNNMAEKSQNHYKNELSKSGIFSFFAAFKNNELNYDHFYRLINTDTAFAIVRNDLVEPGMKYTEPGRSIRRWIHHDSTALKPNVIMITIESFSAEFMGAFGNTSHLTPVLDSLAQQGVLFTNMYATGTRTVRGMEALSLGIPPTPGNSIVRSPNNENLTTTGHIFGKAGYSRNFIYGGDGYFDNMNNFFGNNGYNITDKGRNLLIKDKFPVTRTSIPDKDIHFGNAWGVCDEDLYEAVIRNADSLHEKKQLFYDFVMTTSNHRPFTFPQGKINLPTGSRDAAVKYTDFAIGEFLKEASQKAWYSNTVFIFVADHCASSAGKDEIDVAKYHIPCIIYYPSQKMKMKIEKTCSQIDLYPTLFGLLNWSYESNGYGKDVRADNYTPRAFLGTYEKLAYLKNDSLVILSLLQKTDSYLYKKDTDTQESAPLGSAIVDEAIAFYQSAYFLFKNNELRQDRSLHNTKAK